MHKDVERSKKVVADEFEFEFEIGGLKS